MTARSEALRIAMVTARAVPFMGGVETHVHEVSRRLAASGVKVTVLTTDTTGELPTSETVDGYQVRRYPAYPRSKDYFYAPALTRHLRTSPGAYDVVHMQGVNNILPPTTLAAARKTGTPSVLTFHTGGNSSGLREALRPLQFKLLVPLLKSAAALVAVCEYERERFAEIIGIPRSSIRLIRNGCESLPIDHAAQRIPGSPLVLTVGRLEEYKGHHRILRAMPAIMRRAPEARLAVVGSGPYEQALRDMARDLGIADKVTFQTFRPDERAGLGKVMSDADVVCLLSEYEAHPVAVMEAVGTGTPALVADTSGLTELGTAGLATTIPLHASEEEIARAVLDIAGAPRPTPPALPTWDDCARQLHDLYREVAR